MSKEANSVPEILGYAQGALNHERNAQRAARQRSDRSTFNAYACAAFYAGQLCKPLTAFEVRTWADRFTPWELDGNHCIYSYFKRSPVVGEPIAVADEVYNHFLNVMPPIYQAGYEGFLMCEPRLHDVTHGALHSRFFIKNGECYHEYAWRAQR